MMKLPDDDGGIFKPTSERLANELYKEMITIVAALASNPSVINLEKWKKCDEYWEWDEQAENLVLMAHEIAVQSKTMHLAMLEEAELRLHKKNQTFDDYLHEAEEDSVSAI